jgi:hypothetical protein
MPLAQGSALATKTHHISAASIRAILGRRHNDIASLRGVSCRARLRYSKVSARSCESYFSISSKSLSIVPGLTARTIRRVLRDKSARPGKTVCSGSIFSIWTSRVLGKFPIQAAKTDTIKRRMGQHHTVGLGLLGFNMGAEGEVRHPYLI